MELESIVAYLSNKTILITGATGFLGMVLVEKILRVQPDVKRLYLLVRATDAESAAYRMKNEILGKELFKVLKETWGEDFDSFISQKVVVIPGDVSFENLGVKDVIIMENMCTEIQIIVSSAANTKFDERYDISLSINTFGVLHMLSFANKCLKLEMLLHISTVRWAAASDRNPTAGDGTPAKSPMVMEERETIGDFAGAGHRILANFLRIPITGSRISITGQLIQVTVRRPPEFAENLTGKFFAPNRHLLPPNRWAIEVYCPPIDVFCTNSLLLPNRSLLPPIDDYQPSYVCGEKVGLILEDSTSINKRVKEMPRFDFEVVEKNLVNEKLNELRTQDASEDVITNTMKDLGIERAKLHGWPNTYVFTKAMGEVLLSHHSKNNLPFVIVRPPIVSSTYSEPFPGWVQGYRYDSPCTSKHLLGNWEILLTPIAYESVIAGYCKGKLTCLLLGPMTVMDMIPVDMVVNSMIAAIVVNANKSSGIIYHVGSSLRNPIKFDDIRSFVVKYFTKYPWINKDEKPVVVRKVPIFKTMATFRMYIKIRYSLPLKGLKLVNKVSGQCFQNIYVKYNQKLRLVMRMVELYRPYMLFKGIFDDTNTEELRKITREGYIEVEDFNFDPTCIDWEDYIMNTHIPGFLKHVLNK
ncbi:putative alcohol-forming fatty acyl-CoA reductase [Rosa chinensis]|uniref:Fatty acyl-CoA reductase n=1 Tax=Rosa chinensis TaxID=74649 RepID=A0A2P6QJV3_ROSCH|nr:putative alcohol-forming fatty acyl-CoA reductase [Rosa chinensis]